MKKMRSYAFTEKYEVNLRNMNAVKRKDKISRNQSRNSEMSTKTKDFIQKICYKKTASIDMTQYGFINDSKLHPVNLLLKPLRAQLEKICGKPSKNVSVRRNSPARKKVKINLETPAPISPRQVAPVASPPSRGSPRTTTSALNSPGSHSPRGIVRRITIPSKPSPIIANKKNVRVVTPPKGKKI